MTQLNHANTILIFIKIDDGCGRTIGGQIPGWRSGRMTLKPYQFAFSALKGVHGTED